MSFRHLCESCWLSEVMTLAVAVGVSETCGCPDPWKPGWFRLGVQLWSWMWISDHHILGLGAQCHLYCLVCLSTLFEFTCTLVSHLLKPLTKLPFIFPHSMVELC